MQNLLEKLKQKKAEINHIEDNFPIVMYDEEFGHEPRFDKNFLENRL